MRNNLLQLVAFIQSDTRRYRCGVAMPCPFFARSISDPNFRSASRIYWVKSFFFTNNLINWHK